MSLLCTLQGKSRPMRIGLLEEGSNLAITDLGLVWMHVYPPQSTCVGVEWNGI